MSAPDVHEIRTVVHVHTTDSDGSLSVPEICAIAAQVGVQVVMFSDHMSLAAKRRGHEGYHHGVLALVGYEHHDPRNMNHLLLFDLWEELGFGLPVDEYFARARATGAISIAAHPDERRTWTKYPPYPWTAWHLPVDGVEVWNEMSEWMEQLSARNKLWKFVRPRSSLRGPTDRLLRKWDETAAERPVAGVGATDAHAMPYRLGPFPLVIFPYKVQFQSVRTHLYLDAPLDGDWRVASRQVYDALRRCRAVIVNRRRGEALGFRFYAWKPNGERVGVGGSASFVAGTKLVVESPLRARLRVVGPKSAIAAERKGRVLECEAPSPGAYRAEAYRRRAGWVYTNHVRLVAP